jgi:hypothetical protein
MRVRSRATRPTLQYPITKLLFGDLRFTEFFAGGQAPLFISATLK